ncbi:MAG: asparagine synthase (glutamine-hydrolyzing) [Endomicrobiales bacterium]
MCGICGKYALHERQTVDLQLLKRMIYLLRHRGPDGFGIYRDRDIGLAHARLSIIDLSGGRQPITNEDRTVWIVYNGEVFNYVELKKGLEEAGHRFYTKTDTEVIVHLYEEKGEDFLGYLNGQFAFALWDKRQKKLILARDRFGIRPLFYTTAGGALLFASEIKALLADPRVKAGMDPRGLDQFFTFWATLPPQTVFKDIFELPPAHYLTAQDGKTAVKRYWDLAFPEGASFAAPADENKYAARLLELMTDAVRIRLRADVPVASYLSGGIDSSFISALVKNRFNGDLQSFSVCFSDTDYDESVFQERMAGFIGTKHTGISCGYDDIGRVMPEVVWHAETPLVRTAPAPLYLLSRAVRSNGIKVVLTGEGADEVLAGYDLFRETRIRRFWARSPGSRFRPLLLKELYRYVADWPRRAPAYLEAFYRSSLENTEASYFSHIPRWETTARAKRYFSRGMKESLGEYRSIDDFERLLPAGFSRWDYLSRAQYIEIITLLSGNLLSSQGDRVMMANSVEGRLPFLDYRVVEFCAALPPALKLKVLKEKYLLKEIAKPFLPQEIVQRSKQAYRSPDSASFFCGEPLEYVSHLLSRRHIEETGYFDHAAVEGLVRKCRDAGAPLISTRDNIAVVGIITTLLADHQFVRHFRGRLPDELPDMEAFVVDDIAPRGEHHEDLLPMCPARDLPRDPV